MRPSTRILVVDDEPAVLQFITRTLRRASYDVVGTSSGMEAASLMTAEHFDLLILDLNMPGHSQDGFDILKSARQNKRYLRILVISGYLDGALLDAAHLLGAAATLPKPITEPGLLDTVHNILGGKP